MAAELALSRAPLALAPPVRRRMAAGLMAASGFAGLGYQIVWTRQGALFLGHETAAVLAVVAAFFGGLAVGALALGRRIERSPTPLRWYAGCEVVIALWSGVLALLMAPASGALLDFTGAQPTPLRHWTLAFGGTFLLLLPATTAMGATLPAMERLIAQRARAAGSIAALYAANTFGAVIGVLATAFWLVPELGLARTAALCALLNLGCAAVAVRAYAEPASGPSPALLAVAGSAESAAARGLLARLAVTGLLGIGYEVLVVRVLSQVAEDTVYTFALLLAVYLVGTALGAAAWQRQEAVQGDPDRQRDRLLTLLAAACLLGSFSLWAAPQTRTLVLQTLGSGMPAALAGEALLALLAFGLPAAAMGALFSHLGTQARAAGIGFSRALGVNTLGAAAAPLLFGVLLLPALGAKTALLGVVAGYLLLASPRAWRRPAACGTAGAALALALWAPPLAFIDIPDGGRVLSYRDGASASVSVVEDAAGVSRLRIDNRQQEGSSASGLADARQALLPLLLHPAPRRALFLGLGTGVTASAAAQDAMLQVDAVELLPEVIEASAFFTRAFDEGRPNPRLHLIAADARRFVRAGTQRYDLIVADNFHPARSGSGALYTVEHFQAVRARLAPGGLFCQWLPLHQLDLDTLRSIVRSFVAANPGAWAMLATNSLETPVLGLVARADAGGFDPAQVRLRVAVAALPRPPADFGLGDEFAVLGSFVAGPHALMRFAAGAPLNTDDRPVVAYRAPRITYAPGSLPRERLLALLGELAVEPGEVLAGMAEPGGPQRLAAYWAARDRFIEIGVAVRPTADVQRMLAQVREPLLSVLRVSPDFRPAYDPLLRMAQALASTDPGAARALLTALAQAQPARPEAAQALRGLVLP